jgi:hypothetical protein
MFRGAPGVAHIEVVVQKCLPTRVLDVTQMYCQLSTARCRLAMNGFYREKEIAFWFFFAIASLLQVRDHLQFKSFVKCYVSAE